MFKARIQARKAPLAVLKPVRCRLPITRAVDKEQVLNDVRAIIAEQLGREVKEVTAESQFVDLGADSLDTVEIMMALEEKFDIQMDEEKAESVTTVAAAADLIAEKVSDA